MPHIAKWEEKSKCVPKPVKFYLDDSSDELKTHTIYELIEETFEALFPKRSDEWFGKFVEVKNLDDYISL